MDSSHQTASTPGASNPDLLSALPDELKIHLIRILKVKDIKSLRLASRSWSRLCAEHIFRDGFAIRPHLNDMARLEKISENPLLAKGVRTLTFFAGDMNMELLMDAMAQASQHFPRRLNDVRQIKILASRLYDNEFLKTHSSKDMLDEIFPRLINLSSINVTSEEDPFFGSRLHVDDVWDTMLDDLDDAEDPNFQDPSLATARYSSILLAAQRLPNPIQTLDLGHLPIDCFGPLCRTTYAGYGVQEETDRKVHNPLTQEGLRKAVSQLRMLRFGLAAFPRSYNCPESIEGFSTFLGSMHFLNDLVVNYPTHDVSFRAIDFQELFGKAFCRVTFPSLKSLSIEELSLSHQDLMPFLYRHAPTLRHLHLSEEAFVIVDDPPVKDLLTNLRDKMHLEKFELLATENDVEIYNNDWTLYKNKIRLSSDVQLLEWYVLGKSAWPMQHDNPGDGTPYTNFEAECVWQRLPANELYEALEKSLGISLEALLEAEWESDSEDESISGYGIDSDSEDSEDADLD